MRAISSGLIPLGALLGGFMLTWTAFIFIHESKLNQARPVFSGIFSMKRNEFLSKDMEHRDVNLDLFGLSWNRFDGDTSLRHLLRVTDDSIDHNLVHKKSREQNVMYQVRKNHVVSTCLRYMRAGMGAILKNMTEEVLEYLLVDDEHKVLYCNIPKCGSTNWKRLLLTLRYKNVSQPMDIPGDKAHQWYLPKLSEYSKRERIYRLNTYFKFMFVRHPLERIYSAYRDKFTKSDPYYNKRIGSIILKKFRPNARPSEIEAGNGVTFAEFVQYLLLPSTYLKRLDHHWGRFYQLCNPCVINYDVIGKFESMESDAANILEDIGITHLRFPTRSESFGTVGAAEMWRGAFSEIKNQIDISMLADLYRLDFELFNYHLR